MKKVHIISLGDTYMFRLAVALREKGYSVSCSGADIIMGAEADILREKDILLADLQPINDPFKEKIDFVVSPLQSVSDHPELIRAKESGLLILSVPELVLRMAKDKIRLVFCNPRHPNRIMSMVLKALRKQNMRCDYVALNEIPGQEKQISLSYDARISLLEGDAFLEEKPLAHQQYKPHKLISCPICCGIRRKRIRLSNLMSISGRVWSLRSSGTGNLYIIRIFLYFRIWQIRSERI